MAMAKFVKPLTETQIKNLKPKATPYADGNNLYLFVYPSGAKSFAYIYTHPVTKKRVKKKIGDYPDLVLFDARDIAHKYSRLESFFKEMKSKLSAYAGLSDSNKMMFLKDFIHRHC